MRSIRRIAMNSKLGHIEININTTNLPFYKDLFGFLGWKVLHEEEKMLGMMGANEASLWFTDILKDVENDYDGIGVNHVAIAVDSQADVDAAVDYIKGKGIQPLFDTPRHRPEFRDDPKETYYQVMFESPDKVLFEVVYSGLKA